MHGPITLPRFEAECETQLAALRKRLEEGRSIIERLALERAGTEKLREQVVALLIRWSNQGFPNADGQAGDTGST